MNFEGARFDPFEQEVVGPPPGAYVYLDQQVVLAVNVALATRRPLLVTGLPGSGKSTLAADVARRLEWAFVETVITSRTRLDDLVAQVDMVRRLADAQAQGLKPEEHYIVPGVLWWAVDPGTASSLPSATDPRRWAGHAANGTVVLLDEIDKAEPDLPNDLLGPLNNLHIVVPEHGELSPEADVLVVITSNRERDMPPAFLRRCVSLHLADQDLDFFTAVATSHFGERDDHLYQEVAARTLDAQARAEAEGRRLPSTAEYLDTVRACIDFKEYPGSPLLKAIEEAALSKTGGAEERR